MHKIKRLRRLCKTMAKKRVYIILRSCKRLDGLPHSVAAQTAIQAQISVSSRLTGSLFALGPVADARPGLPAGLFFIAAIKLIYNQLDT
jgi:hypothetical protein